MLAPWNPHTHDVRTMVEPGSSSRSPASFERPYTDWGLGSSHSTYGSALVPSNT